MKPLVTLMSMFLGKHIRDNSMTCMSSNDCVMEPMVTLMPTILEY